ncbi:MAG: C40 family peptidase [Chloroflexota bacterium]|nr:C40 family peptidase [Chloroflexota bacterium]
MTGSVNSGDLLGGGLGRLALALCILSTIALLVPFGLASIGFGAILGVAGGLEAPSAENVSGQPPVSSQTGLGAMVPPPLPGPSNTDLPYASELLAQARSWLGTRYVFGGCSPSGIDCSCFVQTIFRSVDISLPRTSQLQYNATVGRGFGTSSPEPGDLVFFFRTYFDAGQDWTHVGVVSRVDSNGTVWMIDAPGARAAGDPPDAPFGQVREEPIAGSWLQHRPTYARIPLR